MELLQINSIIGALSIPYILRIQVPNKLASGDKVIDRKYGNKEVP